MLTYHVFIYLHAIQATSRTHSFSVLMARGGNADRAKCTLLLQVHAFIFTCWQQNLKVKYLFLVNIAVIANLQSDVYVYRVTSKYYTETVNHWYWLRCCLVLVTAKVAFIVVWSQLLIHEFRKPIFFCEIFVVVTQWKCASTGNYSPNEMWVQDNAVLFILSLV
jgi:hypothetical protein